MQKKWPKRRRKHGKWANKVRKPKREFDADPWCCPKKSCVSLFFSKDCFFFLFFDFVFVRFIFVMKSNEYTMVTTSLGSLPLRPSASFFCSPTTFFSQFSRIFFTFLGVRIPVGWLWSFVIGPYPQLLWPPFLPPHFRKYFLRFLSFFNGFVEFFCCPFVRIFATFLHFFCEKVQLP